MTVVVHTAARMAVGRKSLSVMAFLVAVAAWSALEAFSVGEMGLLYLAPALLLVLPLLFGRYVGEERIAALAAKPRRPMRRPAQRVRLPRPAERLMHRGGRLVASSLAKRPPPALGQHLSA
jgi:hypothetical protein